MCPQLFASVLPLLVKTHAKTFGEKKNWNFFPIWSYSDFTKYTRSLQSWSNLALLMTSSKNCRRQPNGFLWLSNICKLVNTCVMYHISIACPRGELRECRISLSKSSWTEISQKQPPEEFYKKAVFKRFSIFTGKRLCWSLFFNKAAGLEGVLFY